MNIYSLGGMIFIMSMYRYAVSFIVVLPTMKRISASVEEAARISGASPWRTPVSYTHLDVYKRQVYPDAL